MAVSMYEGLKGMLTPAQVAQHLKIAQALRDDPTCLNKHPTKAESKEEKVNEEDK